MKKIYAPFLLLAGIISAGMMMAGCNKDFLQKPAGGSVTADTVFGTMNQAQYAIADMYGWCIPTGFALDCSHDAREDILTDNVHLVLPGAAWVGGLLHYQNYIAGGMTPSTAVAGDAEVGNGSGPGAIDRGPNNAYNTDNSTSSPPFQAWYKAIRKANLVLANIDKVRDADAGWKSDVKGQAIFCRAMAHFCCFRMYGGIPLVTDVLGEGEINIPRSSIKTTVDSIVSWCDQAAALLPATRSNTDYGKATSLAALALKARILLYAASPLYNTPDNMKSVIAAARFGDARDSVLCYPTYDKERWNIAAQAAKAVIDAAPASGVSLYNTGKPTTTANTDSYVGLGDYEAVYNNVSVAAGTTYAFGNPEMILVNTFNQQVDGTQWGQYNFSRVGLYSWGAKNDVPIEFLQLYEKKDGTKWTATPTGTDFKSYFEGLNLDPRAYQSICYAGQRWNSSHTFVAYYKASADGTSYTKGALCDDTNAGDNTGSAVECAKFVARVDNTNWGHFVWPVFRLAEFYLSYAEALNEYSGPTSDAFYYMNLIRERAGMPDKTSAMLPDQATFRDAIQNERSVELAFEVHRYDDLHRWLKAHIVLNQTFHGFAVTASTNGVSPKPTNPYLNWNIVTYGTRVFPMKYYYVPIPYPEVAKMYLGGDGWSGQNPGW